MIPTPFSSLEECRTHLEGLKALDIENKQGLIKEAEATIAKLKAKQP
jgi:hypothetical protein